jgi:SEC-C motif/Protein of unknown function (DUF1186)
MKDLLRPAEIQPLQHPVLESLIDSDALLPNEILEDILSLPRASAIEDLIVTIQQAIFEIENGTEKWAEDFSVIHALALLGHFRAEEKLPFLLDLFAERSELVELLISDFLTETSYMVFYHCGQNQIPALKEYVKDFGADNIYAKTAILKAMGLMAQKQEDKKAAVLHAFHELFDFVLAIDDEDLADSSDFSFFCSKLCIEVWGLGDQVFLVKAKKIYDKILVETFFSGTWEYYEKNFNKPQEYETYDDICEWYRSTEQWNQPSNLKGTFKSPLIHSTPSRSPIKAEPKVGRNDPCPCGSGKKYKKCHGKA